MLFEIDTRLQALEFHLVPRKVLFLISRGLH
jgi:hypothetical protein